METTWTPKVCKIMALMAVIMGLGLLFYILLGFRHLYCPFNSGCLTRNRGTHGPEAHICNGLAEKKHVKYGLGFRV